CAGSITPIQVSSRPEFDYALRLILGLKTPEGVTQYVEVGQMSESFRRELGKIWSMVDVDRKLKPTEKILHLYLMAVTTVGLTEDEQSAVPPPFNKSGFGL